MSDQTKSDLELRQANLLQTGIDYASRELIAVQIMLFDSYKVDEHEKGRINDRVWRLQRNVRKVELALEHLREDAETDLAAIKTAS